MRLNAVAHLAFQGFLNRRSEVRVLEGFRPESGNRCSGRSPEQPVP